jgi:uncharacterized protein
VRFWDSSALVPLLVDSANSKRLASLYKENIPLLAWWGTKIECASAIARLEREGKLDAHAVKAAFARLQALHEAWQEIQPVDALRDIAIRLLRVHALRAADSMQLAAAVLAAESTRASLEFVCLDARLALAAAREGFTVIDM